MMALPEASPALPDSAPSAPVNTEEARRLLQARLRQFGRINTLMAAVFLVLSAGVWQIFRIRGAKGAVLAQAAVMLVSGVQWRLTRAQVRDRSNRVLGWLDSLAILGDCGFFIALGWYLPIWTRPELFQLLAVTDLLMLRAFLVPSTARKTAALGGINALAIVVSTGLTYAGHRAHPDAPPAAAYVTVAALFGVATVFVTALTSRTIFGLRARVREAVQLGQYTLLEKIGEGGMGVVYRARHALLRRPTAIKLLPPDRAGRFDLARFEREAQLTSLLTHPNTVSIYDYGRTADGVLYYAMEYLDGIDLETLVRLDGPQEPGRVVHLLRQMCGALDEAHRIGLIHRDVKPGNVLLCARGGDADFVKVVDFGLVKSLDAPGDAAATAANQMVGTPLYMSPESIVAPDKVDARSDVYAVGAVGYFLLTGAAPFVGATTIEICGHHLHTLPLPPAERLGAPLPASLERLILRCLEKSPDARPPGARSLAEALAECTDVPPWTLERAAAWWRARQGAGGGGRRAQAFGNLPGSPTVGETVAVDLRPRLVHTAAGDHARPPAN